MDRQYLSFGGGVNSTALLLLLTERKEEFEAVFVDHGGDYPETYEYVKLLQDKGYPITVVKGVINGDDLYDYCLKYRILPCRRFRWCTMKFKVNVVHSYYEKPCFEMIGLDAGESNRAKNRRTTKGIEVDYPLIRWNLDRNDCLEVIKKHGLPAPRKSGCYFCPFARGSDFRRMRDQYPELWCKTLKMEQLCNERLGEAGKKPTYLKDKPLSAVVQEGQKDLFGERKPCRCWL